MINDKNVHFQIFDISMHREVKAGNISLQGWDTRLSDLIKYSTDKSVKETKTETWEVNGKTISRTEGGKCIHVYEHVYGMKLKRLRNFQCEEGCQNQWGLNMVSGSLTYLNANGSTF